MYLVIYFTNKNNDDDDGPKVSNFIEGMQMMLEK